MQGHHDCALAYIGSLENEIATLLARVAKFEDAYQHYHKAHYVTRGDEDFLTDDCDECPFDMRDPIHFRGENHE
jgi:hypothetical protein